MSITLGIETSCDETAIALLEGETHLRAHALYSQIELHRKTGGVVPEVASRLHLEKIFPLIEAVFKEAGLSKSDIDAVAATQCPGLIGCLLVGTTLGKAIAFSLNKPFIGVNHIEGHMHAPFLEYPELRYPFISLTVSGGHTAIYRVEGLGEYHHLGQTVDDAAGEVLDKIARLLNLGYPGGPVIDRLGKTGDRKAYLFTPSEVKRSPTYMSFSGLKTKARRFIETDPEIASEASPKHLNFIASFQEAVVDELLIKLKRAHGEFPDYPIAFGGGVSINSRLREKAKETFRVPLYFSSPRFCADNAAMIAYVGRQHLNRGQTTPFSQRPEARGYL